MIRSPQTHGLMMKIALVAAIAATLALSSTSAFAEAGSRNHDVRGTIERVEGATTFVRKGAPCKNVRASKGTSDCGKFVVGAQISKSKGDRKEIILEKAKQGKAKRD